MQLCTLTNAQTNVPHTGGAGGSTYLADVSIQDATSLSKLDLISQRLFVWGFQAYAIQISRYLAPGASPTAIPYVAQDVEVNGHNFEGAWPISWNLRTDKSRVSGGFMLFEQLTWLWFKQDIRICIHTAA